MTVTISIQLLNDHILTFTANFITSCLWKLVRSKELGKSKFSDNALFSITHDYIHIGSYPINLTQPSHDRLLNILTSINKVLEDHPEFIYLFDFSYQGQLEIFDYPPIFINTLTIIKKHYKELFGKSITPKYQSTLPTHIQRIIYDKLKADNDTTCSICLSDMDFDDFIVTKCGHYFHNDCLANCSNQCPVCRQPLV